MSEKPLAIIRIKIETRSDGTVYISSDDIPGLWLWGRDRDQVFKSVVPTIEELYRYNNGQTVKVREALLSRFAQEKQTPDTKFILLKLIKGLQLL